MSCTLARIATFQLSAPAPFKFSTISVCGAGVHAPATQRDTYSNEARQAGTGNKPSRRRHGRTSTARQVHGCVGWGTLAATLPRVRAPPSVYTRCTHRTSVKSVYGVNAASLHDCPQKTAVGQPASPSTLRHQYVMQRCLCRPAVFNVRSLFGAPVCECTPCIQLRRTGPARTPHVRLTHRRLFALKTFPGAAVVTPCLRHERRRLERADAGTGLARTGTCHNRLLYAQPECAWREDIGSLLSWVTDAHPSRVVAAWLRAYRPPACWRANHRTHGRASLVHAAYLQLACKVHGRHSATTSAISSVGDLNVDIVCHHYRTLCHTKRWCQDMAAERRQVWAAPQLLERAFQALSQLFNQTTGRATL